MAEVRCIILAGAPENDRLSWDSCLLLEAFQTPVKRFLNDQISSTLPALIQSVTPLPKWRSVPLHDDQRADGEETEQDLAQTQFLSFNHGVDDEHDDSRRMQFLQDALTHLNELESSEIADLGETSLYPSTFSMANTICTTSFGSLTNLPCSSSSSMPDLDQASAVDGPTAHINVPTLNDIVDLQRIPPASHLARIHPQTLTITVLAAVISVSAPRTVRLRRQPGKEIDIIEVLLGDETRAGFSVSFWLAPAESQHKPGDDLRDDLLKLRAGDVVSVRNVALRDWKGCVYGQSLSRKFAKNSTSIVAVGAANRASLPPTIKGKAKRVERWSWEFVGRREGFTGTARTADEDAEVLPPDTQSPVKRRCY
ncbi:hypothetical protein Tdes44962_MAKER05953 [Teratosphaeria destructans]|uniref:Nucleic acid-binding protein n=1 Tax=Teratosphaeria destructans TaxID=418781 RepID=A0A9W7SIM4_9PEZI|nr:hypothetical protein Tdes44962_MAKER05953 [Teratosphaeria destructans]